MKTSFSRLALCALLLSSFGLTGCDKIKSVFKKKTADSPSGQTATAPTGASGKPGTAAAAVATPSAAPSPARPSVDKMASAIVLCYHNIEDKSGIKALTISVDQFRKEMQAVKDNGFSVVGMQDFLAWRRGEKSIPHKSCIITIDDGWQSGYTNAWPILKEFGYPFTLFIYVNYVGTGGKSLSWDQLAEMRDAGVDIQCHTYSHSSLKQPGGGVDRHNRDLIMKDVQALGVDGWRRKEILESKQVLEKQLGIKINALAYPFGVYDNAAREMVKQAGYEAAFTVYGQRLTTSSPFDLLGRYAVAVTEPKNFENAMGMIGGGVGPQEAATSSVAQLASASMITEPQDGSTITNPTPTIKVNLATMGDVDPASLKVRLSGLGALTPKFDPATKTLTAPVTQKLAPGTYTVIIEGQVNSQRAETRWSFNVAPASGAPAASSNPPPAPAAPKR